MNPVDGKVYRWLDTRAYYYALAQIKVAFVIATAPASCACSTQPLNYFPLRVYAMTNTSRLCDSNVNPRERELFKLSESFTQKS